MRWYGIWVLMLSLLCAGSSCSSKLCAPGETQECACPGGLKGAQSCNDQGEGWQTCQCPGSESNTQEQVTQEPLPEASNAEPVQDAASPEPPPDTVTPEPPIESKPAETKSETPAAPELPVTQGDCQSKAPKCPSGYLCRDDVQTPKCHKACNPDAANSCPNSALCLVLQSGEGICVNGAKAKLGESCDNNNICTTGLICLRSSAGSPKGTCRTRCTLQKTTCPAGKFCYLVHSKNGVCLDGQAGNKDLGQACKTTPECKTGLICFTPFQQSTRCAQLCDPETKCPKGERCAELKGAPPQTGACVK